MSFIYMHWVFLEEYDMSPEEIANYLENSWRGCYGKLDTEERLKLIANLEKERPDRGDPPDWWLAVIRIIRSRTEYF